MGAGWQLASDIRYDIKDMGSEIWLISYEMWTQVEKIMWYARGYLVWLLVLSYLHAKAQIKCIVCPHLFLIKRKNSVVDVSDASCLTCELISMGSSAPYLGSTCPECGANRRWPDNPFSWKYFSAPVETPDTSYHLFFMPQEEYVNIWRKNLCFNAIIFTSLN